MPGSTQSDLLFAIAFLSSGLGWFPAFSASGSDEFINDAGIKSSFETKLGALFEAGGIPKATDVLKQLREEKRSELTLPAPAPTQEIHPPEVYERTRNASLVLGHLYLCGKCENYHANLAGGVILSPDGLVLTNFHVIDFKEAIVFGAMTANGTIFGIEKVVASSKQNDLALLKLREAKDLTYVVPQEKIETGEEIFVISHPDGHFYTLTKGYLARKYLTPKQKTPMLQITADFAKGSSGAGIFNALGELAGIATSTSSIYYDGSVESPENLQMVIKSGIPASSLRGLFSPEKSP
ncbi:MAG: serine protease [Verrucomicrobiales bacterium]